MRAFVLGLSVGVVLAGGCGGGSEGSTGPQSDPFKVTLTAASTSVTGAVGSETGFGFAKRTCPFVVTATASGGDSTHYAKWSAATLTWTSTDIGQQEVIEWDAAGVATAFGADSLRAAGLPATATWTWWDYGSFMVVVRVAYKVMPAGTTQYTNLTVSCH